DLRDSRDLHGAGRRADVPSRPERADRARRPGGEVMETMRAVVMRDRKLVVAEVPMPSPGPGEVLVRTLACGICGSDLHALKFADKMVDAVKRSGGGAFGMDLARDIVMGHEFCAEVVEFGPGTQKSLKAGARVCSFPIL